MEPGDNNIADCFKQLYNNFLRDNEVEGYALESVELEKVQQLEGNQERVLLKVKLKIGETTKEVVAYTSNEQALAHLRGREESKEEINDWFKGMAASIGGVATGQYTSVHKTPDGQMRFMYKEGQGTKAHYVPHYVHISPLGLNRIKEKIGIPLSSQEALSVASFHKYQTLQQQVNDLQQKITSEEEEPAEALKAKLNDLKQERDAALKMVKLRDNENIGHEALETLKAVESDTTPDAIAALEQSIKRLKIRSSPTTTLESWKTVQDSRKQESPAPTVKEQKEQLLAHNCGSLGREILALENQLDDLANETPERTQCLQQIESKYKEAERFLTDLKLVSCWEATQNIYAEPISMMTPEEIPEKIKTATPLVSLQGQKLKDLPLASFVNIPFHNLTIEQLNAFDWTGVKKEYFQRIDLNDFYSESPDEQKKLGNRLSFLAAKAPGSELNWDSLKEHEGGVLYKLTKTSKKKTIAANLNLGHFTSKSSVDMFLKTVDPSYQETHALGIKKSHLFKHTNVLSTLDFGKLSSEEIKAFYQEHNYPILRSLFAAEGQLKNAANFTEVVNKLPTPLQLGDFLRSCSPEQKQRFIEKIDFSQLDQTKALHFLGEIEKIGASEHVNVNQITEAEELYEAILSDESLKNGALSQRLQDLPTRITSQRLDSMSLERQEQWLKTVPAPSFETFSPELIQKIKPDALPSLLKEQLSQLPCGKLSNEQVGRIPLHKLADEAMVTKLTELKDANKFQHVSGTQLASFVSAKTKKLLDFGDQLNQLQTEALKHLQLQHFDEGQLPNILKAIDADKYEHLNFDSIHQGIASQEVLNQLSPNQVIALANALPYNTVQTFNLSEYDGEGLAIKNLNANKFESFPFTTINADKLNFDDLHERQEKKLLEHTNVAVRQRYIQRAQNTLALKEGIAPNKVIEALENNNNNLIAKINISGSPQTFAEALINSNVDLTKLKDNQLEELCNKLKNNAGLHAKFLQKVPADRYNETFFQNVDPTSINMSNLTSAQIAKIPFKNFSVQNLQQLKNQMVNLPNNKLQAIALSGMDDGQKGVMNPMLINRRADLNLAQKIILYGTSAEELNKKESFADIPHDMLLQAFQNMDVEERSKLSPKTLSTMFQESLTLDDYLKEQATIKAIVKAPKAWDRVNDGDPFSYFLNKGLASHLQDWKSLDQDKQRRLQEEYENVIDKT